MNYFCIAVLYQWRRSLVHVTVRPGELEEYNPRFRYKNVEHYVLHTTENSKKPNQ